MILAKWWELPNTSWDASSRQRRKRTQFPVPTWPVNVCTWPHGPWQLSFVCSFVPRRLFADPTPIVSLRCSNLNFLPLFHSFSISLTRVMMIFPKFWIFLRLWKLDNLVFWSIRFLFFFLLCRSQFCFVFPTFLGVSVCEWLIFLLSSVYLFVYLLLCKWGNSCCLELRGVTGTSKEWRIRAMLVYIVLHVNNLLLSVPSFLSKVRTSQRILTHLQGQFAFYALIFSVSFSALFSYTRY